MKSMPADANGMWSGDPPETPAAVRARASDYVELAKPRLNMLVVATTAAGYYLGASQVDGLALFHVVCGTALVAAGASALNQAAERETDGLMRRTERRPVPRGRVRPVDAQRFGAGLALIGLLQLALGANALAAVIALATLAAYLFVYTPLKVRTSLSTVVGAVPGALPPMIGWAAARGALTIEAWTLFAIVFLWQMPHFLAIAWIYREDYERAGMPLLPVVQPDGRSTAQQAVIYTIALLLISLLPSLVGLAGRVYLLSAAALTAGLLALAIRFARERSIGRARQLFLGSVLFLPLLWVLMIVDRIR